MKEAMYRTPEKIDISTNPKFSEDLKNMIADGKTEIVIDMEDTVYISSVGLRTLLAIHRDCAGKGGKMVIRNAGEMVKSVMEVTGFSQLFNIE